MYSIACQQGGPGEQQRYCSPPTCWKGRRADGRVRVDAPSPVLCQSRCPGDRTGSRPGTGLQVLARRRQSVSHRPLAMLGRGQSRPGPGLGPASAAASSVGPIPRARASATVLITASNGSSCSGAIGRGPRAVTIGSVLSAWYGPAGLCCRAAEWPPRPRPPLTVT